MYNELRQRPLAKKLALEERYGLIRDIVLAGVLLCGAYVLFTGVTLAFN